MVGETSVSMASEAAPEGAGRFDGRELTPGIAARTFSSTTTVMTAAATSDSAMRGRLRVMTSIPPARRRHAPGCLQTRGHVHAATHGGYHARVQAIYLVILVGVMLAVAVPLILRFAANWGMRDVRTQFVVTVTAGVIGSTVIVSLRANLVPDSLEAVLRLAIIPVGTAALAWIGWLVVRTH